MVTVQLPDHIFQTISAAASAQQMSFENYLYDLTTKQKINSSGSYVHIPEISDVKKQAADSIRSIARSVANKATIEELISDRHLDHKC